MQNKNSIAYALFETWRINYENGNIKPPSRLELNEMTKEKAHQTVVELLKYIFEYLGLKPLELTRKLHQQRLEELKVGNIFLDYLIFPPEYSTKRLSYTARIDYLARMMYPDAFNPIECSEDYIWLLEYLRCEQYWEESHKKPKITLTGNMVYDRHKIEYLLLYYITNHPIAGIDNDVKKMYDFFATPKVNSYLSKSLLKKAIEDLFDSPLEALHYTYPECQRSEFLYNYELFKLSEEGK